MSETRLQLPYTRILFVSTHRRDWYGPVLTVCLLVVLAGAAAAGPFEDALKAYLSGDYTVAARGFRQAAEQGNATAQYNLGNMYYVGEGVPQSYAEAMRWYRQAAEQDHARAQIKLGVMYANGRGVPQDYTEAARWYRQAAEKGDTFAQAILGNMYAKGEGVRQDSAEAAQWFRRMFEGEAARKQGKLETCDGPYKGKRLSAEELADVLALHENWEGDKPVGQKANLCEAVLEGANLQGASLAKVDLREADLTSANLAEANLAWANLQGAHLWWVNLRGANLFDANLQGASLMEANLQGAFLNGANLQQAGLPRAYLQGAFLNGANLQQAGLEEANLQGAILESANLQQAGLREVNLQQANLKRANLRQAFLIRVNLQETLLNRADLQDAWYEPISTPDKAFLGGIEGLSTVWFSPGGQSGLVMLRATLKEVGLRTLEREATYALKHTERCFNWPAFCNPQLGQFKKEAKTDSRAIPGFFDTLDGLFTFLFFELTCAYGLQPGRPLLILFFLLIPGCALLYMPALRSRGRGGIWVCWWPERIYQQEGDCKPALMTNTFFFPGLQARAEARWWGWVLRRGCELWGSLYFSLLSAFHIGWRDLNVGTWIARIQSREYTLRATGWVRTVSGLQSLLSVYLLALWALTYFGRPFE